MFISGCCPVYPEFYEKAAKSEITRDSVQALEFYEDEEASRIMTNIRPNEYAHAGLVTA